MAECAHNNAEQTARQGGFERLKCPTCGHAWVQPIQYDFLRDLGMPKSPISETGDDRG